MLSDLELCPQKPARALCVPQWSHSHLLYAAIRKLVGRSDWSAAGHGCWFAIMLMLRATALMADGWLGLAMPNAQCWQLQLTGRFIACGLPGNICEYICAPPPHMYACVCVCDAPARLLTSHSHLLLLSNQLQNPKIPQKIQRGRMFEWLAAQLRLSPPTTSQAPVLKRELAIRRRWAPRVPRVALADRWRGQPRALPCTYTGATSASVARQQDSRLMSTCLVWRSTGSANTTRMA
jgi:hypothetical protein